MHFTLAVCMLFYPNVLISLETKSISLKHFINSLSDNGRSNLFKITPDFFFRNFFTTQSTSICSLSAYINIDINKSTKIINVTSY